MLVLDLKLFPKSIKSEESPAPPSFQISILFKKVMKALCHVMPFHTGWHTPSLRGLHDPGAGCDEPLRAFGRIPSPISTPPRRESLVGPVH